MKKMNTALAQTRRIVLSMSNESNEVYKHMLKEEI
jgi:hypothetical protein